jgi:hypothetical protein
VSGFSIIEFVSQQKSATPRRAETRFAARHYPKRLSQRCALSRVCFARGLVTPALRIGGAVFGQHE